MKRAIPFAAAVALLLAACGSSSTSTQAVPSGSNTNSTPTSTSTTEFSGVAPVTYNANFKYSSDDQLMYGCERSASTFSFPAGTVSNPIRLDKITGAEGDQLRIGAAEADSPGLEPPRVTQSAMQRWILVGKSDTRAELCHTDSKGNPGNGDVVLEKQNGNWQYNNSGTPDGGDGVVYAFGQNKSEDAVQFATRNVDSATTTFTASINNWCNDQSLGSNPIVQYTDDAVIVTIMVKENCDSAEIKDRPVLTKSIKLDSPLGNRKLEDGATLPVADPLTEAMPT